MTRQEPNELAVEYLLATRGDSSRTAELERSLAGIPEQQLRDSLADDAARIAFWLDVYNAAVVRAGSVELESPLVRLRHFSRSSLVVAGQRLSLDAVEHGLLRRSRWKLGFGYLGNPVPGRFERACRVGQVDPRIHFALNCGAASCPPIAAYDPARLDDQLVIASASYLGTEAVMDADGLRVPALLLWYMGDFGGPRGLRRLLRDAGVEGWQGPIHFSAYDWTPTPGRWLAGRD